MFFFAPSITDKKPTESLQPNYYSVEFPLNATQPVYQFKLRQSVQNTFFLLVKSGSDIVSQLKVGHILPMKYYSEDSMHKTEVRNTQIMEIVKETHGRFRGHYRIELDIMMDCKTNSPYSENNDIQKMRN
jgi:hypothetical protein